MRANAQAIDQLLESASSERKRYRSWAECGGALEEAFLVNATTSIPSAERAAQTISNVPLIFKYAALNQSSRHPQSKEPIGRHWLAALEQLLRHLKCEERNYDQTKDYLRALSDMWHAGFWERTRIPKEPGAH